MPAIKLQSIFLERRGGAAFFLSRFFRKKIRRKCRHHLRGKNVVFLFSEVSIQIPDPAVKDLAELVTEIINDLFLTQNFTKGDASHPIHKRDGRSVRLSSFYNILKRFSLNRSTDVLVAFFCTLVIFFCFKNV